MEKDILIQYCDLQQEIKEIREKIDKTERELLKIEEQGAVIDKVTGGEGGIQHYRIEGFPYPEYGRKKVLLNSRKTTLEALELELLETLNKVEEFISGIEDSRMRRIVNLRIVESLSWRDIAKRMGGGNTDDGVRKAFERFIEKR